MNHERVIVYIDGFNLYFGLKDSGWKRYYWLNIGEVSKQLLKPFQVYQKTKYFTSRISFPPDKVKRQNTYLEALMTLPDISIYFGTYRTNTIECNLCKNLIPFPNEKMTDVNIAVEMLSDAFNDAYDTAMLISADSDLSGTIRKIKTLFPHKKIVAAFPPKRFSFQISQLVDSYFTIGRKKLANSVFPDIVIKPDGYKLMKPDRWR